jgi:glycerol-3-phosphate dehydrogenase
VDGAADLDSVAQWAGLPTATVERLLGRYGSAVSDLFELIAADADLGKPIPGTDEYLAAEAVYAVTHEGALHLDDVLTRRTRISIESPDRGLAAAPEIAWLIAPASAGTPRSPTARSLATATESGPNWRQCGRG